MIVAFLPVCVLELLVFIVLVASNNTIAPHYSHITRSTPLFVICVDIDVDLLLEICSPSVALLFIRLRVCACETAVARHFPISPATVRFSFKVPYCLCVASHLTLIFALFCTFFRPSQPVAYYVQGDNAETKSGCWCSP